MKFATLWSLKESVDLTKLSEAVGRRADYEFPEGLEIVAEFWTSMSSPAVILIFETDNAASLMINAATWIDVFDVQVFPVNTWQEGLEGLTKHFSGE